jgi:hypothetical protein
VKEAAPGRSCPLSYRYGARALSRESDLLVDTLWLAGGLYGNRFALERLLELYDRDPGPKALVFNGDFHWFDIFPEEFACVDGLVAKFCATRGNVETELAHPGNDTGCGCGYPEWVDDGTVERSNRIIERLRAAASRFPDALERLAALPMHLVAEIGGERVAIVHGDAESLAGWGFSQETLSSRTGQAAAAAYFKAADVRIFASSHTCLPVLQCFARERVIVNNGAAGMPNFRGTRFGLATRISVFPGTSVVYSESAAGLCVEAVALEYDAAAWQRRFLAQWPAGSDAHRSYYERIANGPQYSVERALRRAPALAA